MIESTNGPSGREALMDRARGNLPTTLRWLASDSVFELDRWLRIPVDDRARFLRDAMELIESCERGAGDPGGAERLRRTDAFLASMAARGEDPRRLLLWIATGPERFAVVGGIDEAELRWRDTLERWAQGDLTPPRYVDASEVRSLVDGYRREVAAPGDALRDEAEALERRWIETPEALSAHDRRLREITGNDIGESPVSFVALFYRDFLFRRWWRAGGRDALDEDGQAGLVAEMVLSVYESGEADTVDWRLLRPLDRLDVGGNLPEPDEFMRPR